MIAAVFDNTAGLILSVLAFAYLVLVIVFPERF
jgi:K+-transporting ATPase KdpF subunit